MPKSSLQKNTLFESDTTDPREFPSPYQFICVDARTDPRDTIFVLMRGLTPETLAIVILARV